MRRADAQEELRVSHCAKAHRTTPNQRLPEVKISRDWPSGTFMRLRSFALLGRDKSYETTW
jgi:hypothetical protein